MKEQLSNIRTEALAAFAGAGSAQDLDALRVKYLGKKGELTAVLKMMGKLSPSARPAMGQLANDVRAALDAALELAKAVGSADRYETMRLLAAVEKDRPAAARLLEDLACVAAAVLEGAQGLGLPLDAAARCAEGCTEARRGMDRSLNQKLLFTLLAAKLCGTPG